MTDREIAEKYLPAFYGSGGVTDTPVNIDCPAGHIATLSSTGRTGKDITPTVYYKVVTRHYSDYGDDVVDGTVEYVYFYLYFPVDANHKHDWTGGMLEIVDGVPKRLVCRSHWDMVVTKPTKLSRIPYLYISDSDHSISGRWWRGELGNAGLDFLMEPLVRPNYNPVELTVGHSIDIAEIAKTAYITHHETWGDAKAMTWCRSLLHRGDYKKLCKKHGAYFPAPWWKIWAKRFPKPSEVYDKYPALFWEIMGRVYE